MANDDSYISQLMGQLKQMFQGQQTAPAASPKAPQPGNVNMPAGPFQAPIKGSWNSSGGFSANSERPNGRHGHKGLDMRAPAGTTVYSMGPGVVTNVGIDPIGGNIVNVQHGGGVKTYYAHLSTVKVQKGDQVNGNTILGTVGATGNAKGTYPHLHFQVWKDGQLADPASFFSVPKYTELSAQEKRQGPWLSERAKQEAMAFNMKDHLQEQQKRRVAFTSDVDRLTKVAQAFDKLANN